MVFLATKKNYEYDKTYIAITFGVNFVCMHRQQRIGL